MSPFVPPEVRGNHMLLLCRSFVLLNLQGVDCFQITRVHAYDLIQYRT